MPIGFTHFPLPSFCNQILSGLFGGLAGCLLRKQAQYRIAQPLQSFRHSPGHLSREKSGGKEGGGGEGGEVMSLFFFNSKSFFFHFKTKANVTFGSLVWLILPNEKSGS